MLIDGKEAVAMLVKDRPCSSSEPKRGINLKNSRSDQMGLITVQPRRVMSPASQICGSQPYRDVHRTSIVGLAT